MFGYTREELETCFAPYFTRLAAKTGMTEAEVMENLEAGNSHKASFSLRTDKFYVKSSVTQGMIAPDVSKLLQLS